MFKNKISEKYEYYVYVYLNPLKKGTYKYGELEFEYEPFYIGKGKNERLYIHAKYPKHCINKHLKNIINKIRKNNNEPIIEILNNNMKQEESYFREIELIQLIGRKDLKTGTLVNLTDGGEGSINYVYNLEVLEKKHNSKIISQFDLFGKYIKTWTSNLQAGKNLGLDPKYILDCCRHDSRACGESYWRFGDIRTIHIPNLLRPVVQCDLNGNIVNTFVNSRIARQAVKYEVYDCCKKNAKTPNKYSRHGYMWFFLENISQISRYSEPKKDINKKIFKEIRQIDISTGVIINTFKSKRDLNNAGFLAKTVYRCCRGELNKTQGFKWEMIF